MAFGNQKSSSSNPTTTTTSRAPFDPYSATGDADPQYGGVYPLVGIYPLLYVDVIKMHDGFKGVSFIVEFEILQSKVLDRPAGTRMNVALNYKYVVTPGLVKSCLMAIANEPAENIDRNAAEKACSADNPGHGRLVTLEVSSPTDPKSKYLIYRWIPVSDELQAQAETLRKEAGFI